MLIQRSLGLLGLVALGIATAAPALADGSASVNGHVLDALTKQPLAAKLTIADVSGHTVDVTTDQEGGFRAVGLEPGKVTVSFVAAGFASQAFTCNVPAHDVAQFDFRADTNVRSNHPVAYKCHLEPATVDRSTLQ
jgi:hypothetical protein